MDNDQDHDEGPQATANCLRQASRDADRCDFDLFDSLLAFRGLRGSLRNGLRFGMLNRRRILSFLAVVSAVAASSRLANAQSKDPTAVPMPGMPGMAVGTMTVQTCIDSCWRSHAMCLETERYCLEKGGMHIMSTRMILLADCAEMCEKTANSLLRRSPQHAAVCTACAQLCDACAKECEVMKEDERMQLCARTCRDCANHCREMSKLPI
jgi:hypothetical protein